MRKLQPLALALRLRLLAIGDVHDDASHANDAAGGVAPRTRFAGDPAQLAALTHHTEIVVEYLAIAWPVERFIESPPILGVDAHEHGGARERLTLGHLQNVAKMLGCPDLVSVLAPLPQSQILRQRGECDPLFAVLERLLDALLPAALHDERDDQRGLQHAKRRDEHDDTTILVYDARQSARRLLRR